MDGGSEAAWVRRIPARAPCLRGAAIGVLASKVYAASVLLPIAEARRIERIALGCRTFAWRISRQGGWRRTGVVFRFRIAGRLLGHDCHPSFDANAAYCRTHVRRVPVPC